MSAPKSNQTPSFTEGGKRPFITNYLQKPEFHVGHKVYLLKSDGTREGPYVIASVLSATKYTLSLENGEAVNNSKEVGANALEEC